MIQIRSCICFLVLQNPRGRMCLIKGNSMLQPISYASIWFDNLRGISTPRRNCVEPVGSIANRDTRKRLQAGLWTNAATSLSKSVNHRKIFSGKLESQQTTNRIYIRKNIIQNSKPGTVSSDTVVDGVTMESTKIEINKSNVNEFDAFEYYDVQQKIESGDTQRLVTPIVFDLETTGLSREVHRIIQIAFRDLNGGKNSTFQTLINPECHVQNTYIHRISTHMVNRPDVPRFRELIPIILDYVRSRQIPNTSILLIAHNARCFDVPFLIKEFSRCSEEIPSDWRFLDTLHLARELAKLEGTENLSGKSVQALREYYGIPLIGKAHDAMSDVHTLSRVLQEMTKDLKLPVTSLVERSFKASEINIKKTKKS